MLKNFLQHECTHKCRLDIHGSEISSAITLRSVSDNQLASFIYCVCANCGHILDDHGRSALHVAAACGKKHLCKWLITSAKADINLKDKESGYTPLHHSIFYGQLDVTVLLAKHGASMTVLDNEEMRPSDHLIKDRQIDVTSHQSNEVYIWGTNANYNLGTGSQQTRDTPELLESLKRFNMKQVCMDKFHSVFVSVDGKAWSCGHGQGGRLGLGSESTVVSPKRLNFEKDKDRQGVAMAAISQDHSVFLMVSGSVFVCGLNCYHALGLSPPPPHIVSPTPIPRALLKTSQPLIGVTCARFHSVVYSSREVFTFGIHAGQLGHSNVNSASVIEPKVISKLPLKDSDQITEVVACNTATAVRVNNTDIYLFYQYECRKLSPFHVRKKILFEWQAHKVQTIEQMGVAGGRFKAPHPSCLPPYEGEDLKLAVLSNLGDIFLWTESCAQFTRCVFVSLRYTSVRQFVFQSNHLAFVSTDGQTFLSSELNLKQKASTATSLNTASQRKHKGEHLTVQDLLSDVTPSYTLRAERLPNLHRAVKITSDPKGYNFGVLQFRPLDFLLAADAIPRVTSAQFQSQLASLLCDATESDVLHDVLFQVGATRFPAHKYILASRCKGLYDMCASVDGAPVLVDNVQPEIFKQILLFVYSNDCALLHPGQFRMNGKSSKQENLLKQVLECATRFRVDDLVEKLKSFKCENRSLVLREPDDETTDSLVTAPTPSCPSFDRHACPELCDVSLTSVDGALIKAHRCLLAGRLEYFRHMLGGGWREGVASAPLQLPIPGAVLHEVINFLYSNSTSKPVSYDSVEYWANLLVVADQLFIERLKQCSELGLTHSLTLKNAVDLLGFADTYNAPQLKRAVLTFIALNMSAFIESRSLESLSDSLMRDLIDFYKDKMKIGHRVMTPSSCDESLEGRVLDISRNHPNPWKEQSCSSGGADAKPSKARAARPGARRRRKSSTLSEEEGGGGGGRGVSESEAEGGPRPTMEAEPVREAKPAAGEKWVKVQQKSIQAQVRIMHAVKESPALLELEHSFTRLTPPSSSPIAIPPHSHAHTPPPPSLEDHAYFPTLGLLSTSPDAKGSSRSVESGKKSSRSGRSEKFSRKINLSDLADHLDQKPVESVVSALPSSSVWGSTATSPPQSSPWTPLEHNSSSPVCLKEILRETKLSTSLSGGSQKSNRSFSDIMADEIKKKDNFIRMTSKCLGYIQLEDRAIQELKQFYNVDNSFEEHLTISRVVNNHMDKPMWINGKQSQSPR